MRVEGSGVRGGNPGGVWFQVPPGDGRGGAGVSGVEEERVGAEVVRIEVLAEMGDAPAAARSHTTLLQHCE